MYKEITEMKYWLSICHSFADGDASGDGDVGGAGAGSGGGQNGSNGISGAGQSSSLGYGGYAGGITGADTGASGTAGAGSGDTSNAGAVEEEPSRAASVAFAAAAAVQDGMFAAAKSLESNAAVVDIVEGAARGFGLVYTGAVAVAEYAKEGAYGAAKEVDAGLLGIQGSPITAKIGQAVVTEIASTRFGFRNINKTYSCRPKLINIEKTIL